jgi:hypothetical protein
VACSGERSGGRDRGDGGSERGREGPTTIRPVAPDVIITSSPWPATRNVPPLPAPVPSAMATSSASALLRRTSSSLRGLPPPSRPPGPAAALPPKAPLLRPRTPPPGVGAARRRGPAARGRTRRASASSASPPPPSTPLRLPWKRRSPRLTGTLRGGIASASRMPRPATPAPACPPAPPPLPDCRRRRKGGPVPPKSSRAGILATASARGVVLLRPACAPARWGDRRAGGCVKALRERERMEGGRNLTEIAEEIWSGRRGHAGG